MIFGIRVSVRGGGGAGVFSNILAPAFSITVSLNKMAALLQAMAAFHAAKDTWYKTWNPEENNGEGASMAVDYVRVWASDVIRE